MKKFLLSFFFGCAFLNAQTNRFIYEYEFVPDSTAKEEVVKENMVLDISQKGSMYYSYDVFVQDSIQRADLEKQMASGSMNINIKRTERDGKVPYKVSKEYPEFKTFFVTKISSDAYKVEEDEKIIWKILPEKQKIGVYDGQKATTTFGGRNWVAWFSSDLPFQDGPYKFHGLPGLIVKLEDVTGSHKMTLVANKKVETTEQKEISTPQNMRIIGMGGKEIVVNEKQFKKLYQDYLRDPSKNMKQMMMGNSPTTQVKFMVKTPDGKEITDINEISKNMEKRVQENEKRNNNRIEPTLYK